MKEDNRTLIGILSTIGASFLFASQDGITKVLMDSLHISQILFFRFLAFSVFALCFAYFSTGIKTALHSQMPLQQLMRGVLITSEIALFALVIHHIGLAEIHTLFATFPLMVTALSVPLLGEQVGWRRWAAVAVGFVGTVVIIRPGMQEIGWPTLGGLFVALMFALYNILTRVVGRVDKIQTSLLYFGFVGLALTAAVVPFYWRTPQGNEVWLLMVICCTGVVGHWLLIQALALVPANILQPFNYFTLVFAITIGYFVFEELLDSYTFLGCALVVASGIYVAHRERARASSR